MREILFRGKRIDNGERVEGITLQWGTDTDTQHEKCLFLTPGGYSFPLRVDPGTVCQYTGLTDKDGRKIFEGDIVSAWSEGSHAIGEVKQRIDGLWLLYPAWQNQIMWGLCPNNKRETTVEVIGNVFDNPELLERGNGK